MLQTDVGRGRGELLHLSEKVTEREEVIKGLMIKLEGLEKKLDITVVHSLDSGTSGYYRFRLCYMLLYLPWPIILHQQL